MVVSERQQGAQYTFVNPIAMKTPERGGLRGTDKAITTCCHHCGIVGWNRFLASTESDTTSALGTRISLEAFKRNPPQPSELT